ncbi:MAG: FtsQ-type POTRA domain-containing protein [Verrucomicrobiae bacterium]|nr:FtsQ-type POTRA domain-containing protein [Verrucomicrobiae bacterium]
MWPFKSKKNVKGNARRDILYFEEESPFKRKARVKHAIIVWVGRLLALGLVIILAAMFADFFKRTFLYKNPAYAIKVIDIQTDGVISREQIRRWAGVQVGDNLIALDISRVRRDLELVPMIKTVSVEKVLPSTLRIRVAEREPIAKVLMTDGLGHETVYTLDDSGQVMVPLHYTQMDAPKPTNDFLPTIIGVGRADLRIGFKVTSPQLLAALRLIVAFERSPMSGLTSIKTVDVSFPGILQVMTEEGSSVVFSPDQFDIQFRRWRMAYEYGRQIGKALATLDLSVANYVPATWREITSVNIKKPQEKQTKPLRRKNA